MDIYKSFASVYDLFMKDVPYDDWVRFLEEIWRRHKAKPELVLELACGTGNITLRLAEKGYSMIGLDFSEDMLMAAREKAAEKHRDILFLLQDMRKFELYGSVDSVICLCDGINYILETDDLEATFKLVNNYLNPGGLFIFDLNTEYTFECEYGDETFTEVFENAAYIWENNYDKKDHIHEYSVHFFVRRETDGFYERFTEYHYEKAHTVSEIRQAIENSGLKLIELFGDRSFSEPICNTKRLYFVCSKG